MARTDKVVRDAQFLQTNNQSHYGIEATLRDTKKHEKINTLQHEQLLKLIAKGFYKELISYGVDQKDVIAVSTHLLDHLLDKNNKLKDGNSYYNRYFLLENIRDEWNSHKSLTIENISISPVKPGLYKQVALWLTNPEIKYSFISLFPDTEYDLKKYFEQPTRNYFAIYYEKEPVGIIGTDYIDNTSRKLEMRKFIGNTSIQGKGIGKRATFLFLYHCFVIMKFNKVFIHSGNTNIRNINLNSKFGFELEGVLFEDAFLGNKKRDIVRMGLLRSRWMDIFS